MVQRIYRMSKLATNGGKVGILPVSPATIWRWVASGHFPKPFKLGVGTTVWNAAEVEAFIASQQEAA
jgi:predicted DNA-binding transcriptional regulator AlpA